MNLIQKVNDCGIPTGEHFSAKAPPGRFRVVVFDQATGAHYKLPDFGSLATAEAEAKGRAFGPIITDIYDSAGKNLGTFGKNQDE
ncbi:hypothetical protein HY971_02220 [Candidatus Kaiserbacteria bacterium]|nr:hypothetical protein [Candidatus Kaiserbacteria bacterium]